MSYTRQIRKTIAVHYSGTISYPASEHGGSKSYSGTVYEDVVVNVKVDTEPFDNSTRNCSTTVDGLTASVAATEIAQIESIKANSRKIGKTLVDGFFKTVRSEISQQINELVNTINAIIVKLNSDTQRCNNMKHQMEVDYNRKYEQYLKIFSDLDNELENRIRGLDVSTFLFRNEADKLYNRFADNDMISTVSISGGENTRLGVQLSTVLTKQRAYKTLNQAIQFLQTQKNTADTINSSIIDANNEGSVFLPVCYMESVDKKGSVICDIYTPNTLNDYKLKIGEELRPHKWTKMSNENMDVVRRYFNEEISLSLDSNMHNDRVRDQIIRLFNNQ